MSKYLYNVGEIVSRNREWFWIFPDSCIWDEENFICSPWFTCMGEKWCLVKLPYLSISFRLWRKVGSGELKCKYSFHLCLKTPDESEVIEFCSADVFFDFGAELNLCYSSYLRDKNFSHNGLVKIFFMLQKHPNMLLKRKRKANGQTEDAENENEDSENKTNSEDEDSSKKKNFASDVKGIKRLALNLKQVFLDGQFTDVVLKVDSQEFKAHKVMLVARSPVFACMFQHDLAEKNTNEVDIPDCVAESFEVFLHYLYTGSAETMSTDNVQNLYYIADKYRVDDLKEECVRFMKSNISEETVCELVALSLRHGDSNLQKAATSFFCANLKEVIRTAQWQKFMADNPNQANELLIKALDA